MSLTVPVSVHLHTWPAGTLRRSFSGQARCPGYALLTAGTRARSGCALRSLMGLSLVLPAASARMVPIMRSLDWMILRRRGNVGSHLVGRRCLRRSLMWIGIRVALRRFGTIGLMIVIVSFGSVAVPMLPVLPAS